MSTATPVARQNALGVLEKLDSASIKTYQMRCVEVRNRNAGCRACADACTSGAITIEDGLLNVQEGLCIGCGTCASVCPTCALEALNPDDGKLLERCASVREACGETAVTVACTEALDAAYGSYDEEKVVEVRCLGRVEESLLIDLARQGVERVELVGRHCDHCKYATGRTACEAAVESASSILEAWNAPIEIVFTDDLPESVLLETPFASLDCSGSSSRRSSAAAEGGEDCLSTGGIPGANEDAQEISSERVLPEKIGRNGTLKHHAPTRRGRIVKALAAIGEPNEATVSSRLWGTVSLDAEKCGSCRMCAVFCPTGALTKLDDRKTGAFGIEHTPAKCVKCRCCEDICRKHAITITEEVFAPDIVDGHVERYEMRPPEIVVGKPTTVVQKMRKLLVGANQVNFA